jgi:2-desacetyl-2-hydroxyethyl bacteriochlorophyllide A dehydrogenase
MVIIMKKIIFTKKDTAELLDSPDRLPEKGEARVKLAFSTVSAGTERALVTGNTESSEKFRFGFPSSSGYSGSGIITDVGPDVTDFKVGDRVMVHGGGHNQFCTVNTKQLVQLPDNVSLEEAALVIISGFSLAAIRKAKISLGDSCLVMGLGILGLFAIQFAKLSGAYPIIGADFLPERRELAKKLGADIVLDPSDPEFEKKCKELTFKGNGVNSVIEVTGNPNALKQALCVTAKFGKVILLGCTRTMTEVDFYNDVHRPGIELIGAHSGARPTNESHSGFFTEIDDCRVIISYLSSGRLDFKPMISESCSPAEATKVYSRLVSGNFPIGVQFDWSLLD